MQHKALSLEPPTWDFQQISRTFCYFSVSFYRLYRNRHIFDRRQTGALEIPGPVVHADGGEQGGGFLPVLHQVDGVNAAPGPQHLDTVHRPGGLPQGLQHRRVIIAAFPVEDDQLGRI